MNELVESGAGRLVTARDADYWASLIWAEWRKSVAGIVETGSLLIEAKGALDYGEWGRMTGETVESGKGMLPFGARTTQMLMAVGADPRIQDPNHGSDLPASWRTLYALTTLDDDAWEKGLSTGAIRADMERKDVAALKTGNPFAKEWSGDNEWYTPAQYIDAARATLGGIDLDPASCEAAQKIVQAGKWYDEESNGLEYPWAGRIWLNPPFKYPAPFIDRLIEACASGATGILLTNNNTDTKWWHRAAAACTAICFTAGRISFYNVAGESSSPTNGQNFFYFGNDLDVFAGEFGRYGYVMKALS
jgi:hypothetical protein